MLLNFRFNNFASFPNEVDFSLKPGKVSNRFKDNVIKLNPNFKVSKVAVIAGPNGGGKTNFIRALHFFKFLVHQDIQSTRAIKKLLFSEEDKNTQYFEITVVLEDKIFTYYLEIDIIGIIEESLHIRNLSYNNNSNQLIFLNKRKVVCDSTEEDSVDIGMNTEVNEKYFTQDEYKTISLLSNNSSHHIKGTYLHFLQSLGVESTKVFTDWIDEKLEIEIPDQLALNVYKELAKEEDDFYIIKQESFLEIFKLVDSSIDHLILDEEDPFKETTVVRLREDGSIFNKKLKYESTGVREFFAWSIAIWKVIYRDVTLFADEVDKVFNVVLASKVVSFIKGSDHRGQFIFSTHNIFHLNTIDFMKEQIFFVEKNKYTLESELYCLSEFSEYRYDQPKVYELYLKGLLGAVPND